MIQSETQLLDAIHAAAHPLVDSRGNFDPLIDLIGDSRFVLIGEASHGTHEFYRARAEITKRLIKEKGFCAVAVEADWPDAGRINRFVRATGDGDSAVDALADFQRFPTWMWRNADVLDFVGWLREHNEAFAKPADGVGFYGLDLYSLRASMQAVLTYLDRVDPKAAERARFRYGCFEDLGEDPQHYGLHAGYILGESCEEQVVQQLVELQHKRGTYENLDGQSARDDYFFAEQNARLAKNAEAYYRQMFGGRVSTWNLRDTHMADTLDALAEHLAQRSKEAPEAKIVIWAHNSHLGDARATEAAQRGELNVGQLVRQRHGGETCSIGFSTYSGTVTAADDWDRPAQRKRVRPGLPGSYEALFHEVGLPDFLLSLHPEAGASRADSEAAIAGLMQPRLQRAIGVIYRPETERMSHYFDASLPRQFDAMIHLDQTRALEPLERTARWITGEVAETYPTGV
jgi:erythromycin esterase-like protein